MNWSDKTILVTGATGSFGTAFFKYLLDKNPWKVICFSRCWLKQKSLRDELGNPSNYRWFIGDVRDKDRLLRAFKNVDIVCHAAAIKDLESCEYNPSETLATNVQGTQNVIDACIERKVSKCLFISTDKSVQAINAYGTSKAMAEKLWLNANKYSADDNIMFSVARYGNVVGSNGSVVPVFRKLIEQGVKELPVTNEDCTRFWFEMPKVLEFVADCLEKMKGGEIFIPKLPSVRITDLCKAFNLPYKVIGIRKGEKIAETMGEYREDGTLIDSSNNDWFLTIDEIRETIKNI